MKINDLFKTEFSLPSFSTRKLMMAFLLLLLPNLIFLALAWVTQTARPLVNTDYFGASLLLLLPWRWAKVAAFIAFGFALTFDTLMFVMQLFPFMDLAGVIYLAPFLKNAPVLYQALSLFLVIYLLFMPWLLHKIGCKTNLFHGVSTAAVLSVCAYFSSHLFYYNTPELSIFGGHNYYYGKSQFSLYRAVQNQSFLEAARAEPVFKPLEFERATAKLLTPRSKKVLLIVNESWGQAQNQALQDAVLAKLSAQKNRFEFFEQGHFPFVGATVEGEMRELCATGIEGFALRKMPPEKFSACLPNEFKQAGYATYVLHGASSQLYDRFSWYEKAGFTHFVSAETLPDKPRCRAFNGACDHNLFADVGKTFAQHDKLFYYWLTLTSHSTYSEADLFNRRLVCRDYDMADEAVLCRNFKLQAQFFDDLAELIAQPEMRGTEILVVGDHTPPTINLGEVLKYMHKSDVAWVHFKVK